MFRKMMSLVLVVVMISCGEKKASIQDLHSEVMEIHDSVMPKMTDLHSSRKELEIALKQGADSTKVFNLLQNLDEADELMMVWMDEFKMPADDAEEQLKMDYLFSEKKRISEIKNKIEKSIADVSAFTAQYVRESVDPLRGQ